MRIELDTESLKEVEKLELQLEKATGAKRRMFGLAMLLLVMLLGVMAVAYNTMVLDFAEIDQLEINWDPHQELVELDYYVVTPGKLEFELGEMLYRTRYEETGKQSFSWGIPAEAQGSEFLLHARNGLMPQVYREEIGAVPTRGQQ